MDIQGAELDAFRRELKECLKRCFNDRISEVEFLPIYNEQPLFGDVCYFFN